MTRRELEKLGMITDPVMLKKAKTGEGMVEKPTIGGQIANGVIAIILCAVMFACFVPMWHVVVSSISDGQKLLAHEGLLLWPVGDITLEGYQLTFKNDSIIRGYGNTLMYVAGNVGCGLCINVIAGYVLSRKTRLKGILSAFVMFTMMFSGGTIPTYMVVRSLGLTGTPLAIIIPGCTNAIFVIMMMNAYNQVPEATVEAARIDGAGHLRVMFQVMLPQSLGFALVTVINTAIMAWNDWYAATIYIPLQKNLWPLQLWIKELCANNQDFLQQANPNYARYLIQYCVIIAATLPILVVFPFFQKHLEKGMVMGAVKE